jgi:hypothetical protein
VTEMTGTTLTTYRRLLKDGLSITAFWVGIVLLRFLQSLTVPRAAVRISLRDIMGTSVRRIHRCRLTTGGTLGSIFKERRLITPEFPTAMAFDGTHWE